MEVPSTNANPFACTRLKQSQPLAAKTESSPQISLENNRQRIFRQAGNLSEIAAGASLNSTVIFTFHLLQVHPIGMFLALGVAHLYFTATTVGEKGRRVTNAITGISCSLALLSSGSELVLEAWESRTTQEKFKATWDEIYQPPQQDFTGIIVALISGLAILFAAYHYWKKQR